MLGVLSIDGIEAMMTVEGGTTAGVFRAFGARTVDLLMDTIDMVAGEVTPSDAAGWFKHCGVLGAQHA